MGKVPSLGGGAIWLTNVIVFALWDGGSWIAAGRLRGPRGLGKLPPSPVFPEMSNLEHVGTNLVPEIRGPTSDFSFSTATSLSPPDVSAIRPWMKLTMIAEEATSLILAVLVISRAVNIFK